MSDKYKVIYISTQHDGQIWSELYKINHRGVDNKLDSFKPDKDIVVTAEVRVYLDADKPRIDRALEFVTNKDDFWSDLYDAMRDDFTAMGDDYGDSDISYHVTGIVAAYV